MTAALQKSIKMPMMKAHDLLGHDNQQKTKATVITLRWTICRGGQFHCVHCAKAKAKRKNIPKNAGHEKATKSGRRMFKAVASIHRPNESKCSTDKTLFVSKLHIRILVDEATNMQLALQFETKDGLIDPTCATLHQCSTKGRKILFI